MLKDVVATKVSQIEAAGVRVLGAGLDSLCEKNNSIQVLNVVTGKHTVLEDLEGDVLAVARDVPMVGQSVESGAGTTSFIKQSV
jgi:hypothetical protein